MPDPEAGSRYERDFDRLLEIIASANPQLDARHAVTGWSILEEAEAFREAAIAATKPEEFAVVAQHVLNLCQDGHTGLPSVHWLEAPTFSEYFVFEPPPPEALDRTRAFVESRQSAPSGEGLIRYVEGHYRTLVRLTGPDHLLPSGSTLSQCRGSDIHEFVSELRAEVRLHWDWVRGRAYASDLETDLRRLPAVECRLVTPDGQPLDVRLGGASASLVPTDPLPDPPQAKAQAFRLASDGIVYLRMPMMWPDYDWIGLIRDAAGDEPFEKLIIDIRSNPGGSDHAWKRLLEGLIAQPIEIQTTIVARPWTPT